ncbi:PH domain-containing protein [Thermococcus sp.]|uniref:PH domain-containing protein n=1 Tax=Thermococcus sp. TaxID=35749 RepID=UPI00263A3703|nr:PH domain-containing protein [Thermococcus sp.]
MGKEEDPELPKSVLRHLEPNEKVLFSIKKKISMEKPKWLLITGRRIIYLDEKVFGRYDLKAIPYQKLEQVTVKLGIMSSEFIIEGEENITLKLGWMNKEEARKAINAIKDALNAIAVEPVSIGVNKGLTSETWVLNKPKEFITRTMPAYHAQSVREEEDPLEKLKKLKELYDMGVISQEEYEEKRKKLLDEI